MSAEFQLFLNDEKWYVAHKDKIANKIRSLNTYTKKNDSAYLLSGTESISNEGNWLFDVRFFFEDKSIFIEISAHPLSIEKDLEALFTWLSVTIP
ncbi:hypothetical protein BGI30_06675 [Snodgrassella alvi]|jgi:hypothetical protein|uniref:hypothetical protein n=1 Tax=Snodgrassella alvi TaxID=1196083 RepID=UPI000C1F4915|nr:hypothetical protein [Snodgrassella alvi]PIT09535.1 hypothetical protein BGI30_06675 [Snodgrassella alvi]PIT56431.1 hypothetical protein BHC59_08075 [Snodgrassella alvi]